MTRKAKAYVRKITRRQALSYKRLAPNPLGVTTIAEINGSYGKAYARTRALLRKTTRSSTMKRSGKRYRGNLRAGRETFVQGQLAKGRSKKQAAAAWRLAKGAKSRGKAKKKATSKKAYGKGRFQALSARVGNRNFKTYMYRTGKGAVRKIPDFALAGYKSLAQMRKLARTDKGELARVKRLDRLYGRRRKAAKHVSEAILRGDYAFAPNAGGTRVLSFKEWKQMKANRNPARKSKKRKKGKKKLTKAERKKISLRNLAKAHAKLRGRGKSKRKGGKRKGSVRKTARKGKMSKAARRKIAIRNLKKACRVVGKRYRSNQAGGAIVTQAAANPHSKKQRAASLRNLRKARAALKKGGKRKYRRNQSTALATVSPRKSYTDNLMAGLKTGLVVLGGYALHRALTKVVDDYAMSKIDALSKGDVATWRPVISGAALALVGIPAAVALGGEYAPPVVAGMVVSLLHGALMQGLKAAKQEKVAAYLGAYPDAEGRAYGPGMGMGSYYTVAPGQVYPTSGFGEYYEVTPDGRLITTANVQSAAAGLGGPLTTNQLTQAAAGVGYSGAGEYIVYGAEGIGEYEEVPTRPVPTSMNEGVAPNLSAAEQALNIMEAAAGLGADEIPYQSTIDPMMVTDPIPGEPGGSRAGVFGTPDGIFGGPAM